MKHDTKKTAEQVAICLVSDPKFASKYAAECHKVKSDYEDGEEKIDK